MNFKYRILIYDQTPTIGGLGFLAGLARVKTFDFDHHAYPGIDVVEAEMKKRGLHGTVGAITAIHTGGTTTISPAPLDDDQGGTQAPPR